MWLEALEIASQALAITLLGRWLALLVLSLTHTSRRCGSHGHDVPVDVLIPAFNEERVIANAVRSALASDYPDVQIYVIDDGSSDDTSAKAASVAGNIEILRSPINEGKAAALNRGLAASRSPVVVFMDADTLLERGTISALVSRLYADDANAGVAANIRVGNSGSLLGMMQRVEYVTGIQLIRRGLDVVQCIATVPGAACAYRREAIAHVGGIPSTTRIEDTDLSVTIQRSRGRLCFEPTAVARTEVPSTWKGLWAQRVRWTTGYLQVIWKHRDTFGRHGLFGWFGYLDLVFRNVVAPVLVVLLVPLAWSIFRAGSLHTVVWALVGLFLLDGVSAGIAAVIGKEPLRLVLYAPIQRLVWLGLMPATLVVALVTIRDGESGGWSPPSRTGLEHGR